MLVTASCRLSVDNGSFIICASVCCSPQLGAQHISINPNAGAMSLFPHLSAYFTRSNGQTTAVVGRAGLTAVLMVLRDGALPGAGVDG